MSTVTGFRPSVLAAKTQLAQGREKLLVRHRQGTPGVQVCAGFAELIEGAVLELYRAALAELGETDPNGFQSRHALVAHSGFGRRDMAPYSDVDLMILHEPKAEQQAAALANRLMRDVFDAGLVLGQSVRTPRQACKLALEDATICTSLMESRLLAGNVALFERFTLLFQQQIRRNLPSVIGAVDKARSEERSQYGETVYLLEPNVKRSRGGLRDVQLLRWIGYARHGVSEIDSLQLRGGITKEDQRILRRATDFLLHLRNELHFQAGKSYDLLDRAEQLRLAEALNFKGQDGLLPVEQFMREYFRRTSEVSQVVTRFVAKARPDSLLAPMWGALFSHQVEGDYRVEPGQIVATRSGLAKLQSDLAEVLRLADLANMYQKKLARRDCEAIREALPKFGDELSPAAAERFLSLLSQSACLGDALRTLHDLGVLEKVIPSFSHARCLLQFNEYHKFTVDEHCLRAVERATEFLSEPGTLGNVYRHAKAKRLLHLALLIHDLGKGYAEDHSDVGLRIAEETAVRLHLSAHETETLKFLVHKHLMMAHLAFRRDTSDEQLVLRFAVEVGSPEVLEMLFVLTCADLAAVGPGVLNNWKVEVLASLYHRAMQHLSADNAAHASEERCRNQQMAVARALGGLADAWFNEQIGALPAGYLLAHAPPVIADDLRELRLLKPGDVRARGRYVPETHAVEYGIATNEDVTPGVFHKLAGALAGKGLQILSAEIYTLAHGLVLDRFAVHDPDFTGEPPASRLEDVSRALEQSLLADAAPSFRRLWRKGAAASVAASLPTQVRVDNSTSDRFTVLDVFAADRTGLLYTIGRTLFELGLSVSVAKISTHLDQVVDVFYVTDGNGRKIESQEQIEEIRTRLLATIDAME